MIKTALTVFVAGIATGGVVIYVLLAAGDGDGGNASDTAVLQPAAPSSGGSSATPMGGAGQQRTGNSSVVAEPPPLTADDPEEAFTAMLDMQEAHSRGRAALRVATAWGRIDPERAMASAAQLPSDEVAAFRSAVSTEWARRDPEGFLEYFARGASAAETMGGVQWLLASDPEALLRAADRRADGGSLRMVAFTALAEVDPLAVLGRVKAMPPGPERDAVVPMVAMQYAMRDPDAALTWLDGFNLTNPMARMAVASVIARNDINRALDMFGSSGGQMTQLLLGSVFTEAAQDPQQASKMATQLLDRRDQMGRTALASLVTNWMQREPESVLRWIESEAERVDADVVGSAASALANRDPALAARYAERLPERLQGAWIGPVAGAYARQDVDAALRWVARFAGRPAYADAYGRIAAQLAQTDPAAAARLLAAAPEALPRAAGTVASTWARRDSAAAEQWALGLAHGEQRDEALTGVLASSPTARNSGAVLAAFSSDAARQRAFIRVIPSIAREDREAAQRLLEAHVTDAALKRQLTEQLGAMDVR